MHLIRAEQMHITALGQIVAMALGTVKAVAFSYKRLAAHRTAKSRQFGFLQWEHRYVPIPVSFVLCVVLTQNFLPISLGCLLVFIIPKGIIFYSE